MFAGAKEKGTSRQERLNLPLLALWLVVFLFYSYLAFSLPHRSSFLSPDENNTYCVARQIHRNHTVYLHSHLNEELGMKIFRGRLYVEAMKNKYTAFNSLGLSFLVAAGMYAGLPFFVVPFLASLGVIGIYLVAREMAGYRAGLLAGAFYGLLPTNVFNSNQILDATPSFAMYLLSLGCILSAMRRRSALLAAFSGAALGLCFLIRQANAVYILALLVFLTLLRKRLDPHQRLAFILPAAVIGLATVAMNWLVYGSIYRSGQVAGTGMNTFYTLFPKFDPGSVLHALSTHLIAYIPLMAAMGLAGCAMAWRERQRAALKPLNILMAVVVLTTLFMYASRSGTWSFQEFSITASMPRYFIPLYAVVIIYASLSLHQILSRGWKAIAVLVIIATMGSYALFTFGGLEHMNLQALKERAETYSRAKERLLSAHAEPMVVFTKRMDKDLYDDIQVGLCFTQEDVDSNPEIKRLFPIVDIERDILPAIDRLIDEGYLVLAASDSEELLRVLTRRGYRLSRMEEYDSLFRVGKD